MVAMKTEIQQLTAMSLGWALYAAMFMMQRPTAMIKGDLDFDSEYTIAELGWIDFCFYASLYIGQVFFKIVIPFRRVKKVKNWFLISSILSCLPISLFPAMALYPDANEFFFQSIMLILFGFFQSLSWIALSRLISGYFSAEEANGPFGIISTSHLIGVSTGIFFTVYVQHTFGWMLAYTILGLTNIVLAFFAFLFIKVPTEYKSPVLSPPSIVLPSRTILSQLLAPVKVVVILCSVFIVRFIRHTIILWMPYYLLVEALHSQMAVGVIVVAFDIGAFVGTTLNGCVMIRVFAKRIVFCTSVCVFASAIALVLFQTFAYSINASIAFLFAAGFFNSISDSLLTGPLTMEIGERMGMAGAMHNLINAVGASAAILQGLIFSWMITMKSWDWAFQANVFFLLSVAVAIKLFNPSASNAKYVSV